jgi:hypothetical protein
MEQLPNEILSQVLQPLVPFPGALAKFATVNTKCCASVADKIGVSVENADSVAQVLVRVLTQLRERACAFRCCDYDRRCLRHATCGGCHNRCDKAVSAVVRFSHGLQYTCISCIGNGKCIICYRLTDVVNPQRCSKCTLQYSVRCVKCGSFTVEPTLHTRGGESVYGCSQCKKPKKLPRYRVRARGIDRQPCVQSYVGEEFGD